LEDEDEDDDKILINRWLTFVRLWNKPVH